ncbi:MAG: DUF805 domain-containing protein [Propionibacterium sp.]|nr:DUF805 domain-containing protein [Propionibacterium sp.]
MTIVESLKYTFSKYATFNGRASRREWVTWWLTWFIINLVLNALARMTANANGESVFSVISAIVGLAVLLPSLAVAARRLHDTGKSAWLLLLNLIPLVGSVILIVLCLGAAQPGPNQYGAPVVEGAISY